MSENIYKIKALTIKVNIDGTIRDVTDRFGYLIHSDLHWNVNDTLKINVENETIEYIRNKFEGNQVKIQCHFEEIIKDKFEEIDARELFCEFPNKPEDIITDEDINST